MVDEFEHDLLDSGAAGGGALSAKSVKGVHAVFQQLLDDAVRRGQALDNARSPNR